MEKRIAELLCDPAVVQKLIDEWSEFAAAWEKDQGLLRFGRHQPKKILQWLIDLQREPVIFTAAEDFDPQRQFYISQDEIDKVLRGSRDYRLDVYAFYRTHDDAADREQ